MGKLSELKPKKVFEYFEEICNIPHGSGNTKQISDYLVQFAQSHGFEYYQDESNNVIIIKEASVGNECSEALIIQGHMDMVCEKAIGYTIDFEKDGLNLIVDGDYIYADKTTLGGDDGIAVAYGLAILDDEKMEHPRLELVVTVDEEIGMLGATEIDLSMLKGRKLLNIDSEEEGIFLTSCAGGITACCEVPVQYEKKVAVEYEVIIAGLIGGHSGCEIDKGRGNATILMGRLFNYVNKNVSFELGTINGGQKDNVIPNFTVATMYVDEQETTIFEETLQQYESILKNEYNTSEPDVKVTFNKKQSGTYDVMTKDSAAKVKLMLFQTPNGIQTMSSDIPGLVETSLNLGILVTTPNAVSCSYSIRSSIKTAKEALADKLRNLIEYLGGRYSYSGNYPAWEYNKDSKLRELVMEVYEQQYGEQPEIQAIHAGLECGIFSGKLEGLDCVSFGPNIYDIHTIKEKISISSVERTWNLITEVIRRSK